MSVVRWLVFVGTASMVFGFACDDVPPDAAATAVAAPATMEELNRAVGEEARCADGTSPTVEVRGKSLTLTCAERETNLRLPCDGVVEDSHAHALARFRCIR
jgi:hypothetical protein